MTEQNRQHDNMSLLETPTTKDGVCGGPPQDRSGMGLCSFESNILNGNEVQYPSRCVPQREASVSGYLPPQDQIINQTGTGGNAFVGVNARGSATNNTTALSSSQWNSPREQSTFAQGRISPLQQQTHVVRGSHVTNKEVSPVTRHHQQGHPLQNEVEGSITGPSFSKPLPSKSTMASHSAVPAAPPVVSVAPSQPNAIQPLMQQPLSSPPAPRPLLSPPAAPTSHPAIRPAMPQPLMGNSPYWPGQHQHVPPLMANLLTSRFQQHGFPRQQFGNGPFVPHGVFNPAMFQGWDPNALAQQQQLLASRLPFGLPFRPVQSPVSRFQPATGGRGIGAAGRGRTMAARFHNPGIMNIKTCGDLEKMNPERSSTLPSEQTRSVHNTTETQKDTVGKSESTASDVTTSSMSLSPDNTDVESRSRETAIVKKTSVGSCAKSGMKTTWTPSSASDSPTIPNEPREETRCQSSLPSQGPGKCESVSEKSQLHTLSPTSSLPKQEGDLESPGTKKISPSKMSPSEMHLKEQKVNV